MSAQSSGTRIGVPELHRRKGAGRIVALTAYTAPMARRLDPHVDMLLVGDSLGMVVYGLPSTLGVTLDMMIAHGAAVVRGTTRACVVVDLPFGAYQESPEQAFRAAARILGETGASAVKLEGGSPMAGTVRFLVERGIPVCGHVGLMPQSVNVAGGFRATGHDEADASRVETDARAIADAGAFAVVIEGTVEPVARRITDGLSTPTIGIGASAACDGQILVTEDLLGLFDAFRPRFVRRYAELGDQISAAVAGYASDVREGRFPGPENLFAPRRDLATAAPPTDGA